MENIVEDIKNLMDELDSIIDLIEDGEYFEAVDELSNQEGSITTIITAFRAEIGDDEDG